MGRENLDKKKVFAVCGHAQSGKTSLCDYILYATKTKSRLGKVDEGTSVSDFDPIEIERKSSVNSSLLFANYKDYFFQFIDTPGYQDFISEPISALSAADAVLIVIDAQSGVEVGTETVWDIALKYNLPCFFFVNKLDKENTDFYQILKDIQESFGKSSQPFYLPVGKESSFKDVASVLLQEKDKDPKVEDFYSSLMDIVAESDDALLEKYLAGESLTPQEVSGGIKHSILARNLFPVMCGSSQQGVGIKELLDFIAEFFPSVLERPSLKVKISSKDEELKIDPQKPFSAQVFKSIFDPYVGQLTIFRVWTGGLSSNTGFYNVSTQTKERIGQLFILQGKEQVPVDKLFAGDIGAVAKLKNTFTQNTIAQEGFNIEFPSFPFPEPAISQSVKPKSKQDEEKISEALHKLTFEDPTFRVSRDPQTKELIISGVGELHLNIMTGKMKRRFGAEVELGKPKIPYKETITRSVKVQGKYKRQTGGRGQYGDVWIEVEPLEKGKNFEFVDKIVGGRIPRNFIPSVEKGIRKAMSEGFLAGCEIVDIRVTLYDGSYHPVDSSDIAFQIAASMALKKAVEQAGPVLLEPIVDVEIVVPEEYMGQITGDINSRRGRILGMEAKGKNQVIKAQVPLSEMYRYATDLRSLTAGRGSYSMKFSHYEQVPHNIAQKIIEEYKRNKEQEDK